MKVMILGAGGAIGEKVAKILVSGGHEVLNVSRRGGRMDRVLWVKGDRNNPSQILTLVKKHKIDAMIDMVGRSPSRSEALLDLIDGELQRYVFISSGDVYRNHGLIHRIETGPPDMGVLSEQSPLRLTLYPYRKPEPRGVGDPDKWMDDYDKIPIEARVQRLKMDWVICRLPMVYGPAKDTRRFDWITQLINSNTTRAELPSIWLDWMTTYGYVDNVAAAIVTTFLHKGATGEIFNLTDHKPMTHLEWLVAFGRVLDWTCEIVPTDHDNHPIRQMIAGIDLSVPLRLSGRKLRDQLGFKPVFDLDDCIGLSL